MTHFDCERAIFLSPKSTSQLWASSLHMNVDLSHSPHHFFMPILVMLTEKESFCVHTYWLLSAEKFGKFKSIMDSRSQRAYTEQWHTIALNFFQHHLIKLFSKEIIINHQLCHAVSAIIMRSGYLVTITEVAEGEQLNFCYISAQVSSD